MSTTATRVAASVDYGYGPAGLTIEHPYPTVDGFDTLEDAVAAYGRHVEASLRRRRIPAGGIFYRTTTYADGALVVERIRGAFRDLTAEVVGEHGEEVN